MTVNPDIASGRYDLFIGEGADAMGFCLLRNARTLTGRSALVSSSTPMDLPTDNNTPLAPSGGP